MIMKPNASLSIGDKATRMNATSLAALVTGGVLSGLLAALAITATALHAESPTDLFHSLPNLFPLPNPSGFVETYNINNTSIDLTGSFFQSLGTNGRSCSSCHRPAEAWSVSADEIQLRFLLTQGLDPIFRTNDGSNCDHNVDTSTFEGRRAAYSLLLRRGLIRIALAVPAGAQFTVVDVQNPYGCNDPSTLSMYRRPLPATNLKFLSTVMSDGRESSPQTGTRKITYATNPSDLLADLAHQAIDATTGHAQASMPPTAQQVQDIVNFEMQLRTAQAIDFQAGFLNAGEANGGPVPLASQSFFIGINDSFPPSFQFNPFGTPFNPAIFDLFDAWTGSQVPARASIARGQAVFNSKPIKIARVAGINDVLGLQSLPGTCGTCHDTPTVGDHSFPAPLNIGVGDLTSPLDVSYLPVITLQNNATGARVQTTDPGRALITGLWADIGKVKGPILRGLAARAPYFHNGSAAGLSDVVTFYDKRFNVGFTGQEKADLIAFLKSL
jgi:cytochrome c peroxidase